MNRISLRGRECPKSGIRTLFDKAKSYDNVINLGIGEPGFATPDHIVAAGQSALAEGYTKYTPNAGLYELREAIVDYLKVSDKFNAEENVIVTTGAGESMLLAMMSILCQGDEVIVPDPAFPNYLGQIYLAGGEVVFAKTFEEDNFHLKTSEIEKVMTSKTKAIILNSPSNPTGAVMTKKEIDDVIDFALENDLWIISDEPYSVLTFDDHEHYSALNRSDGENKIILIDSFSKSYCMTGWRVGYTVGPSDIIGAMVRLQESVASCVNSSAQKACIAALKGPQVSVEEMRKDYDRKRAYLFERIEKMNALSCFKPEGAFYAFVNIQSLGMSSLDFALELLDKEKVVVTNGSAFGDQGEGYIRISYAGDDDTLRLGLDGLERFVSQF